MANRPKVSGNYKGVSWHKQKEKWRARIKVDYKEYHLGLFNSEVEAALAYDAAARLHFGSHAQLNF